jgi:hypothetical protein
MLGGAPQMLADDAEDGAVSPDGSQIAFFRRTFVAALGREGNGAPSHTVRELVLPPILS